MNFPNKLKVLAVCTFNNWRSPTAQNLYRGDPRVEVRSAGISESARHKISIKDVEWAGVILCMETEHKNYILKNFKGIKFPPIKVLDISSGYTYMDPELINLLRSDIENLLGNL